MTFFRIPNQHHSNNPLLTSHIAALPAFAVALIAILLMLLCACSDNRQAQKEKGKEPSQGKDASLRSSWDAAPGKQSPPEQTGAGALEKPMAALPASDTDTISAKTGKSAGSKKEMVWIKGGSSSMGSIDGQDDEKPVHRVTIKGFYLDKAEVTQEEYRKVMGKNPAYFKNCPECPVENVTWGDARKYCDKIGKRLPQEDEWEYAYRAGTRTKYPWGDAPDGNSAWYDNNADFKTHPVKTKAPSAHGLYDMSGNVWEWCEDVWRPYPGSRMVNEGRNSAKSRIIRGGAWDKSDYVLRSAARGKFNPNERSNNIGFRCAM